MWKSRDRLRAVAAYVAGAVSILGISMLGWASVISIEPQAWARIVSEQSVWMLAIGESSFIALCAVGLFWLGDGLTSDCSGILADYGIRSGAPDIPTAYTARQIAPFAVLGALASLSTILWDPFQAALRQEGGATHPFLWYVYAQNLIVWTLAAAATSAEAYRTVAFVKYTRAVVHPDLLEPVSSRTLLHRGYRTAVVCFLLVGSLSVLWSQDVLNPMGGVVAVATAAFLITVNFVYPLFVLRSITRQAKQRELAQVAEQIRAARAAPAGQVDHGEGSPRMSDLVAYRQMILATNEWPLDVGAIARVATAMLLALSSWFGDAVVAKLLDRLL